MDSSSPKGPLQQTAPPSLQALQLAFSQALHYHTSDLGEQICDHAFAPDQLVQIYRNNFIISLTEVLGATYPCTAAVVGEDCFTQLARQHVLSVPLTHGDVSDYGEGFAGTLTAILAEQPALAEAVPYLADLARLEWQIDIARQQPPMTPAFPFEQLGHINDANIGRLRFEPASTTACLDAGYPVATLWQMIQDDDVQPLDFEQTESVIIQHRADGIWLLHTTPDATALVTMCQQTLPLSTASAAMLDTLGLLIQHHVFTAIHGLTDIND